MKLGITAGWTVHGQLMIIDQCQHRLDDMLIILDGYPGRFDRLGFPEQRLRDEVYVAMSAIYDARELLVHGGPPLRLRRNLLRMARSVMREHATLAGLAMGFAAFDLRYGQTN